MVVMPVVSTLRRNSSGHDCPSPVRSFRASTVRVTSVRHCSASHTPHVAITTSGSSGQKLSFATREQLIKSTTFHEVKLRFMRSAHAARHWSDLFSATSAQCNLPPGIGKHVYILVGPIDQQNGMFPVGCAAWIEPHHQIPGEVDVDWLEYYKDYPARETSQGIAGSFQRQAKVANSARLAKRKPFDTLEHEPGLPPNAGEVCQVEPEQEEQAECIICMDGIALFSWEACNHNSALLCSGCAAKTQEKAKQATTACVLCRGVSILVLYQGSEVRPVGFAIAQRNA